MLGSNRARAFEREKKGRGLPQSFFSKSDLVLSFPLRRRRKAKGQSHGSALLLFHCSRKVMVPDSASMASMMARDST